MFSHIWGSRSSHTFYPILYEISLVLNSVTFLGGSQVCKVSSPRKVFSLELYTAPKTQYMCAVAASTAFHFCCQPLFILLPTTFHFCCQQLFTFAANRFSLLLSTAFHFCCQPLFTFVVNCFSLLLSNAFHFCCQPIFTFAVNRVSLLLSTAFHFCCQQLWFGSRLMACCALLVVFNGCSVPTGWCFMHIA